MTSGRDRSRAIYATIWRWHFYAGLFVIPFVLLLAATGAAYLFKRHCQSKCTGWQSTTIEVGRSHAPPS